MITRIIPYRKISLCSLLLALLAPVLLTAGCNDWLRKITVNMAVITKSTPSVLKGSTEPTTAPRPALATQIGRAHV